MKVQIEAALGPEYGGLNKGYIYEVIHKMERDGLITSRVEPQAGMRPDRSVLEITERRPGAADRLAGRAGAAQRRLPRRVRAEGAGGEPARRGRGTAGLPGAAQDAAVGGRRRCRHCAASARATRARRSRSRSPSCGRTPSSNASRRRRREPGSASSRCPRPRCPPRGRRASSTSRTATRTHSVASPGHAVAPDAPAPRLTAVARAPRSCRRTLFTHVERLLRRRRGGEVGAARIAGDEAVAAWSQAARGQRARARA